MADTTINPDDPTNFKPFGGRNGDHDESPGPFSPGDRVGKYVILSKIASGGFAVVYLARQVEGVQREVALKALRTDRAAEPEVRLRFRQEQQLLATMSHPNVVQVYEVGETERGVAFCAMQYIQGPPITNYCDENHLSLDQRLKLMAAVCRAVYYVSQKGIIHRDLSPSNILIEETLGADVASIEGVRPVIIDFNAAKWLSTPRPGVTTLDQVIGKATHMSPEQLSPGIAPIDYRTDVYSLGVVLYELLVGHVPIDTERFRSRILDDLRRFVHDFEPEEPSSFVSSLGDKGDAVATNRATTLRRLVGDLRSRGINAIPLRALEKSREHRYQSAREMAEDLDRVLRGERPVAEDFSLAVWIEKKIARYRPHAWAAVAIAAGVIIAALGLALAAWIATVERDKTALQRDKALAAEQTASRARTAADIARDGAESEAYAAGIAAADLAIRNDEPAAAAQHLARCAAHLRNWEWAYLDAQRDSSLRTLASLASTFNSLSTQSGSIRAFTTMEWGRWDRATGQRRESGRRPSVVPEDDSLIVSGDPGGRYLVSHRARAPACLYLHDTRAGDQPRIIARLPDADAVPGTPVVAFSDNGRFLAFALVPSNPPPAANDAMIQLIELGSPAPARDLGRARCAAFSRDSSRLVIGDPALTIFDPATGAAVGQSAPRADAGRIRSLTVDQSAGRVAAVGERGLLVWTVAQAPQPFPRLLSDQRSAAITFLPDNRTLAAASGSTLRIFDAETGREAARRTGSTSRITCLAPGPNPTEVVTGSEYPGELRLWDLAADSVTVPGLTAFSSSGNQLLLRVAHDQHQPAAISTAGPPGLTRTDAFSAEAAAIGPKGLIAACDNDGTVRFLSADGSPPPAPVSLTAVPAGAAERGRIKHAPTLRWFPDGSRVVCLRAVGDLYLADVIDAAGKGLLHTRQWEWPTHRPAGEGYTSLAVAQERLAVCRGSTVSILRPDLTQDAPDMPVPITVMTASWDASGNLLAMGQHDGRLLLWKHAAPAPVVLGAHAGRAPSLAWTGSPQRLVSAGSDGLVKLWDISAERLLLTIDLGSSVRSLVALPSGDLAAATATEEIRLLRAPGPR